MPKKILVIEDEASIRDVLRAFLEDAGYTVFAAGDGPEGVSRFRETAPDLVLLDLMLPGLDGFSVCKLLRRESTVPIVMLTALDDEDNQVKGFDALADDYITKPFSMPVVIKRIQAVLRRTAPEPEEVIRYKGLVLDAGRFSVQVDGQTVPLTTREFEILQLLLAHQGRVFTRDNLLDRIWGLDYVGDPKIVNTHIKNIRKKLGASYIETIRGVGYKIEKEDR